MGYDVILIHPPAVYDFRKRPIFPGALGDSVGRVQYVKVPIGMLSIAEYLDRHGYKVLIDNLADRMVGSQDFDVEEHIKSSSARIYAVGLHFQHHAQGAIEIARLCKKLHPDSLVIVGGLTATRFHEEIIQKYEFVDAVIRGEAEKAFLEFIRALEKHNKLTDTPNLTYRTNSGEVRTTPLMAPSISLDEYDFTRLDLLEPKTSIFGFDQKPRWSLEVCRGCIHNCNICGGSAYTYKKYLGREKPAFRDPVKIVKDAQRLSEQGVRLLGLYQDPRMGGEQYWKKLMEALRGEKLDMDQITIDIFSPVNEEFVREAATIGKQVIFNICPDTGCNDVRKNLGRFYSNEELLGSVKLCHRYHIPVTLFFAAGLAGETHETMKETWHLWEKLRSLDQEALGKGTFGGRIDETPIGGPIIGPIFLDPGSLAFDFPQKYGYKLAFNNLEEYIAGMSLPSWHQWLNYETSLLSKDALLELIFESVEYTTCQREKFGLYDKIRAANKLVLTKANKAVVDEVNRLMKLPDKAERESRLTSLRDALNSILEPSSGAKDPYGYHEMIKNSVLADWFGHKD